MLYNIYIVSFIIYNNYALKRLHIAKFMVYNTYILQHLFFTAFTFTPFTLYIIDAL